MSFGKVLFKFLIIEVILWIASTIPPITDMASLMLLSAVIIEFVVAIESLLAKLTFGMALEA